MRRSRSPRCSRLSVLLTTISIKNLYPLQNLQNSPLNLKSFYIEHTELILMLPGLKPLMPSVLLCCSWTTDRSARPARLPLVPPSTVVPCPPKPLLLGPTSILWAGKQTEPEDIAQLPLTQGPSPTSQAAASTRSRRTRLLRRVSKRQHPAACSAKALGAGGRGAECLGAAPERRTATAPRSAWLRGLRPGHGELTASEREGGSGTAGEQARHRRRAKSGGCSLPGWAWGTAARGAAWTWVGPGADVGTRGGWGRWVAGWALCLGTASCRARQEGGTEPV